MRLLLDTHVAIWTQIATWRLSGAIHDLIADTSNDIFVSSVSIFEIAIKFSLAKRSAPPFSGRRALELFESSNFRLLSISSAHAAAVDDLPALNSDPFDRLLVAQALSEPLRFVTGDRRLFAYSDTIIRV